MELMEGMIAKVRLGNDPYHGNTQRAHGIEEAMIDASYIKITEVMFNVNHIRGRIVEVTNKAYYVDDDSFNYHWSACDLRPTTLAKRLRRAG